MHARKVMHAQGVLLALLNILHDLFWGLEELLYMLQHSAGPNLHSHAS